MVAPITGPFTRSESFLGNPNSYGFRPQWVTYSRTWYRQRRPYNRPLTFTYQRKQVMKFEVGYSKSSYRSTSNCAAFAPNSTSSWFPNVYNKAYAKFINKLKPDTAGLGINLAQKQQAIDMISARSLQLIRFIRELKAFRLGNAAKELGIDPKLLKRNKKLKRGSKNFANNFLEVHFGWSPLLGDIGSSVDVLQSGVPPCFIRVSQKGSAKTSSLSESLYGKTFYRSTVSVSYSIGATVTVSNPNLFLANQLGFVNPALIAYDAIPFSFVLNWFVNVEQFLSSFSDLWGLTLSDQYIVSHSEVNSSEDEYLLRVGPTNRSEKGIYAEYRTVSTYRNLGSIPGPALRIRSPWTVSPTRGLTAISLLIQKLKR